MMNSFLGALLAQFLVIFLITAIRAIASRIIQRRVRQEVDDIKPFLDAVMAEFAKHGQPTNKMH